MSETVHYVGKLIYVSKYIGENLEDQCKRLMNNDDLPKRYDSYAEWLVCESNNEYYVNNDSLYKVELIDYTDNNVFIANIDSDGEINFQVKYYNGGCNFQEAVDEALNTLGVDNING